MCAGGGVRGADLLLGALSGGGSAAARALKGWGVRNRFPGVHEERMNAFSDSGIRSGSGECASSLCGTRWITSDIAFLDFIG